MRTPVFVLLVLHCVARAAVVPVTDSNLLFSSYNWVIENGTAFASNPGASLKFGFVNSSSVAIVLDTSNAASPSLVVEFSVDDSPWAFVTPGTGSVNQSVVLASNLNAAISHDVRFYLYASSESVGVATANS